MQIILPFMSASRAFYWRVLRVFSFSSEDHRYNLTGIRIEVVYLYRIIPGINFGRSYLAFLDFWIDKLDNKLEFQSQLQYIKLDEQLLYKRRKKGGNTCIHENKLIYNFVLVFIYLYINWFNLFLSSNLKKYILFTYTTHHICRKIFPSQIFLFSLQRANIRLAKKRKAGNGRGKSDTLGRSRFAPLIGWILNSGHRQTTIPLSPCFFGHDDWNMYPTKSNIPTKCKTRYVARIHDFRKMYVIYIFGWGKKTMNIYILSKFRAMLHMQVSQ